MIERTANIVSEDGIVKMTSKGWGGIIYRINRDKFAASILDTDKLEHCDGIYILVGKKTIRVGKGDIYTRVGDHKRCSDPKRNFFDYVIVITSPISGLDDTQQGYIEYKWIKKLKEYKKYKVTNDVTPDCPSNIQDHDRVSTEEFMMKAEKFIQDICNEAIFEDVRNHSKKVIATVANTLSNTNNLSKLTPFVGKEFVCKSSLCEAKGIYLGNGKISVIKGSTMRLNYVSSYTPRQIAFRESLENNHKIVKNNTHYIVQEYIEFPSLSAASSTVLGNSSNGRLDWKYGDKPINELLI